MRTASSFLWRSVGALAATAVVVAGPLAAGAALADDDGGGRLVTSAEAVVTRDGRMQFDSAFRIADLDEDVVDPGNYAFAHAKGCEGCQAVALSYQIVLVQRPPDVVTPENISVALNEECASCVAASGAYQFVVGGEPVELTWDGRKQLKDIAGRVEALRRSGLPGPDMVDQADLLADEIDGVLKTQLRSVDGDDDHKGRVEEHRVKEVHSKDAGRDDRSDERGSFAVDG
jgi:hypothetical protein